MSDIKDLRPKKFGNWIFPKADPSSADLVLPIFLRCFPRARFQPASDAGRSSRPLHQDRTVRPECNGNSGMSREYFYKTESLGNAEPPANDGGSRPVAEVRMQAHSPWDDVRRSDPGQLKAYDEGHYHTLSELNVPIS